MTYLDELSGRETPTFEDTRNEMKTKCQTWVEYCDLPGSLNDAFQLWDAVCSAQTMIDFYEQLLNVYQVFRGVKAAENEVMDDGMWIEVDQWLFQRR